MYFNDMALELKLHSPAGAESIVYSWPLQKSVSFSAGIWLSLEFCGQDIF